MRFALLCAALLVCSEAGGTTVLAADGQADSLGQMLAEFSRCNVSRQPEQARAYVLSADVSPAADKNRPFDSHCLYAFKDDVRDTFIASWYRNELAIALVQNEFSSRGPESLRDKLAPELPPIPDRDKFLTDSAATKSARARMKLKVAYDRARSEAISARMGACAAKRDPEAMRLWIVKAVGDADLASGGDRLRAVHDDCAHELGTTYGVDRGYVALGYYRLAKASSVEAGK